MATRMSVSVAVPNYKPEPMDIDQYIQMTDIARRVQSHLPFESATLIDFMNIARLCFGSRYSEEDRFRTRMELFKKKYYPYKMKPNTRFLSGDHLDILRNHRAPRFKICCMPEPYEAIEKVAFLKSVRAYRNYFDAGMTDKALDELTDVMKGIHIMLNKIY
jgi:hypothetical protein